jgi:hypothetical protein
MKKNNNPNLIYLVREINKKADAKSQKVEEKFEKKSIVKREKFLKKFEEKVVKHIVKKKSHMLFYMGQYVDANDILIYLMKCDRFNGIGFSIMYNESIGMHVISWYITEGV